MEITAVDPDRGEFELEILAFEDAGARWRLALEDVEKFQFERGSPRAGEDVAEQLRQAVARFDRPLEITVDESARRDTLARIRDCRQAARAALAQRADVRTDVAGAVARREGDPSLVAALGEFLGQHGLEQIDHEFAGAFVTNPNAGELVKGHAIVLAELGLCPYRGKIVRDPGLFEGDWSSARRADHLIARLAFSAEMWLALGHATVTLYRGASSDSRLRPPQPRSFVSATFSAEVAQEHFAGGATTQAAVLWRQNVAVERVLMTFLETAELNARFKEAEAVLLGDPESPRF